MRQVATGNPDAFAELYDRNAGVVLGFLRRMVDTRGVAEELLQDTFLQAWDQSERYDGDRGAPRSWILTMAHSRAIDWIRSSQSRRKRNRRAATEGVVASQVVDRDASERLADRERTQQIRDALDGIPEEQRAAIELAFFGGLTHTQVAEALDAPLGTVKSRILLGFEKLRSALGGLQ